MSAFPLHGDPKLLISATRAIKNAKYLQERAGILLPGGVVPNFLREVPMEILRILHLDANSRDLIDSTIASILKQITFPELTASAVDPLFGGTLHFVQIAFTIRNQNNATVSVSSSDMRTAVTYASAVARPISAYAAQYGPNSVNVNPNILTFSVTLDSAVYNNSLLASWVNLIAERNSLPANDCIVVVNPQAMNNTDGSLSKGVFGYHDHANLPYIFLNLRGQGLTVADLQQFYATNLSHEIAETVVDPLANFVNPEVCDPCGPNCQSTFVSYFRLDGVYLGSFQFPTSPPFAFDLQLNGIVKPISANACPAPAVDCAYFTSPIQQQHVFYRGIDGAINHIFWDASAPTQLFYDQWTDSRTNAPLAAGNPATMVTPGQQHVFYRGIDGAINHIFWDASVPTQLFYDQWTDSRTNAPLAAGNPATMVTPGQQHVFYRGIDGAINHIFWDASVPTQLFYDQWTDSRTNAPVAAGNPATMVTPGQQHVFYRGIDGAINHIFWDASVPTQLFYDQWTDSRTNAPLAAGNPATMVTPGQQHVFYRGIDGAINHIFWDASVPTQLFYDQWTDSRTNAPVAAGNPATMVTPGQQHVFYRGIDGAINHIFWDASAPTQLIYDQWTDSRTNAPVAAGNPATMNPPNQQHVFYRGIDGAINHIFWDSSTNVLFYDSWTDGRTKAPIAAGATATMITDSGGGLA